MVKRLVLFTSLAVAMILAAENQAAKEHNEDKRAARQTPEDLLYDPYSFYASVDWSHLNQLTPRIGGFHHEGLSIYRHPFTYYHKGSYDYNEESKPQARLNGLGASAINNLLFNNRFSNNNNRFRPLAGISNLLPISLNPNYANPLRSFDSCTSPSGESGVCAPGSVCNIFGGRSSGSCPFGGVCCVNSVSTCGGTVTLNNTYWSSPTTGVSTSSCNLRIRLDTGLTEQTKPICQVRLDFASFTIAQPNGDTTATPSVCGTDTFQVGGASNAVPVICGDNDGQHMYLSVPSSGIKPREIQLLFNFGADVTLTRSWKIKISMLPCGADYLAPTDCLQYFTTSAGIVRSFNYFDTTAAIRQLANQDYNICFRSELINNQQASSICLRRCAGTTSGFRISSSGGRNAGNKARQGGTNCRADFIIFALGTVAGAGASADRFCGENLHTAAGSEDVVSVCSSMKPFKLYYHTDGTEEGTEVVFGANPIRPVRLNAGFCLEFTMREA